MEVIARFILFGLSAAAAAPSLVTAVEDRYAVVSPDGTRLLFDSNRSGATAVWTANADGTALRPLITGADEPNAAQWSPDGKQIVFSATSNGESEIFLANADGGGRRRLTNYAGDDNHPHWSADGRRIFFNSDRETPDRSRPWIERWHNLYSVDLSGEDLRRHTDCRTVCTNPNPSPDGRKLVFRRIHNRPGLRWSAEPWDRNSEIVVLDLATGKEVNVSVHPAYDTWPSWSPDSEHVVFGSNRRGSPNEGDLYVAKADGSNLRLLLSRPGWSLQEPSFSPDGAIVYFSRGTEEGGKGTRMIAAAPVTPSLPSPN